MLTKEDLTRLHREFREERVLSVYICAEPHDPPMQGTWRVRLDHALAESEQQAADSGTKAAYERALAHLKKELPQHNSFLPEKGWTGFATEARLLHADFLPVPMPDRSRWDQGLHVAPYVRVLKQTNPVTTVLVDSRRARLFSYAEGEFEEIDAEPTDMLSGDLSDGNISKRVAGETNVDVAKKLAGVGSEQLLKYLTELIRKRSGPHGTVIVGGTPEMTAALIERLQGQDSGHVQEEPTISFYNPLPELKRATEAAASLVTARKQAALLEQVLENAHPGARCCLGRARTEQALAERRVQDLLLSQRLVEEEPAYADSCISLAFEQDAQIEELAGASAERLDRDGEGVGARFRF